MKEYILSVTISCKRVLHVCRNEKQTEVQKGFKPINLRSVCVFFYHQHRESSVCHLASLVSFLSTHTEEKCKKSINKPLRSGTLLIWHIQAHSFQLLDEKQRDRHMECMPKPSQMDPFEIYETGS